MAEARRRQRILVVDDDQVVARAFRRGFELRGFVALTADSIAEAEAVLFRERPDVLVIDMRVGCESGIDLARSVRARRPDATIVMISGYFSVVTAVAAVRSGADHVLPKPITCGELLRRLSDAPASDVEYDDTPSRGE